MKLCATLCQSSEPSAAFRRRSTFGGTVPPARGPFPETGHFPLFLPLQIHEKKHGSEKVRFWIHLRLDQKVESGPSPETGPRSAPRFPQKWTSGGTPPKARSIDKGWHIVSWYTLFGNYVNYVSYHKYVIILIINTQYYKYTNIESV